MLCSLPNAQEVWCSPRSITMSQQALKHVLWEEILILLPHWTLFWARQDSQRSLTWQINQCVMGGMVLAGSTQLQIQK